MVIEAVFPDELPEINNAITIERQADARAATAAASSARSSSTSATTASARSRWT